MCSQSRELAHIKPHIYDEGCGHRLTERKREREQEKEREAGAREGERGRKRSDGSTLAHEFHPFSPKIKRPNKC